MTVCARIGISLGQNLSVPLAGVRSIDVVAGRVLTTGRDIDCPTRGRETDTL